jgi:uncharacterized protein YcbK (DUF882 family)
MGSLHGRRRFLALGSLALGSLVLPRRAQASPSVRSLAFRNTHTDEALSVVYWADGRFEPDALKDINRLLRDVYTGDVEPIDTGLLDLLHDLRATLGATAPFHVISGYRSAATNARLRRESGGVARHSLHLEGRAADVRLPGVKLERLREAALSLQRGGVGFYPASDFVHVDTGRVRRW